MSYIKRLTVGMATTIGIGAVGIVYFRVGIAELFGMAQDTYSGPFSPVIGILETLVPVALTIILLGTWLWVLYGGVQRERQREVRRI